MPIQTTATLGDSSTLKTWLDIASSFCEVVENLDRKGVNQATWGSVEAQGRLHWHGMVYLRAAGASVDRFSQAAYTFVKNKNSPLLDGLAFTVEAGDPIVNGELAVLRIQSRDEKERRLSKSPKFIPVG